MRLPALFALALAACAAPSYVAQPRIAPKAIDGVLHDEATFDAPDKTKLFRQSWRPSPGSERAALVLVHGLRDHCDNYAAFAAQLTQRGIAVFAFDLRGHGQSAGDRVWIDSFSQYLDDLDPFIKWVHEQVPGKPVFLFGHSMGGAIVTTEVLQRKPDVAGVLLSAPALKPGADVSGGLIAITGCLSTCTPSLAVFGLDPALFSRDPETVKQNTTDPLVYQGNGPARTGGELLDALAYIDAHMEDFAVPFFAAHGDADKITNPQGSVALGNRAKTTDKTVKLYPGLWHDLLHEPERAVVAKDFADWLDAHAPK